MAEYLVHAVVVREEAGVPTALAIQPQIGQLFRIAPQSSSMSFRLSPDAGGNWTVEVNPINSKLQYSLVPSETAESLCQASQCKLDFTPDASSLSAYYFSVSRPPSDSGSATK
jgi:hypothetical protein